MASSTIKNEAHIERGSQLSLKTKVVSLDQKSHCSTVLLVGCTILLYCTICSPPRIYGTAVAVVNHRDYMYCTYEKFLQYMYSVWLALKFVFAV